MKLPSLETRQTLDPLQSSEQENLGVAIQKWGHKSKNACNLIWWAVLAFQDVMKQQEIRRNKEEKTKKLRKKKPKIQQKPPHFCRGSLLAIFDYKLGMF